MALLDFHVNAHRACVGDADRRVETACNRQNGNDVADRLLDNQPVRNAGIAQAGREIDCPGSRQNARCRLN